MLTKSSIVPSASMSGGNPDKWLFPTDVKIWNFLTLPPALEKISPSEDDTDKAPQDLDIKAQWSMECHLCMLCMYCMLQNSQQKMFYATSI